MKHWVHVGEQICREMFSGWLSLGDEGEANAELLI